MLKEEGDINGDKIIVDGIVLNVEPVIRGQGIWAEYRFESNGSFHESKKRLFIESSNVNTVKNLLVGKLLQVVYSKNDVSKNDLPITKIEFNRYHMERPDSLLYVFRKLDSLSR